MSQQIPAPRSGGQGHGPGTDVRHELWVPTLVRAVVALVFGAVTIFWQAPTQGGAPWVLGLFFAGTGVAWLVLQHRLGTRDHEDLGTVRTVPQWLGILYILGGVVVVLMAPGWLTVLLTALILGLAGFGELAMGLGHRDFPLGRDWILSGLVTVAAGMGVMLVETLGTKAELGVVGGAAIIIGVTQFIAALSLRHDARVDGSQDPSNGDRTERVD